MNKRIYFFFVCLGLSLSTALTAQLQTPSEFLPHDLGEHFIQHYLVVDYFEHVAANSDQVILERYGYTNQNRPLVLAYVSSKENLANLEQIRQNNLIRTGLVEGEIKEKEPIAIVKLGFGVHGNEAGATNSSVATIYDLADPNNAEVQEWLKNTVVIVEPSINPDGYSRYTHWNTNIANHIPNPHAHCREHDEPWPTGRVNHYCFDLNRDWAWATQVETQQRLVEYQKWMPHINVDAHEQGYNSPYYFAPAAQPYHEYITDWQSDFQTEIGLNHAKYFDEEGWLYFTREVFDLFYPSYGDTYPTFCGSIGMTYEQAGHGRAGLAILIENGDTLKLIDRILHHKTAALSTVEISSKNAGRLVENFEKYYNDSNAGNIGKYNTYIVKGSNGRSKIKELTQLLDRHQIRYGNPSSTGRSVNALSFQTGKNSNTTLDKEDLVISTKQPMSVLMQVLFEPKSKLVDSLTYDITAWSLPYAYGLESYATTQSINPTDSYTFSEYTELKNSETPYAYLAEWNAMDNVRFLTDLMQQGVLARSAWEAFELDGQSYDAGTLVILKIDNQKKLGARFDAIVQQTARKYEQKINTARTGFVTKGHDFGSSFVKIINPPKVLALSGESVSYYDFGQVWHFFEQEIKMPLNVVDADALSGVRLADYDVLIMPSGWYSGMDEAVVDKVQAWIREGGKLIAMGSAVSKLQGKGSFGIKRKSGKMATSPVTQVGCYAAQERSAIINQIPGAIYKTTIDNTHPLGFGITDTYFSLKTSGTAYEFLDRGWNVGFVKEDPTIIGFAGANVQRRLENSLSFGVQDMGSGQVIYLVDNPLFRGFWKQGNFLFSNAVFMVR